MRYALLAAALLTAPALASAQGAARGPSIVVTAPSIRVRTAPSIQSLSIDDFAQGSVFVLAPDEHHSVDWLGIWIDGRLAFVPRYAVALRTPPQPAARATEPVAVAQSGGPAPVAAPPVIAAPRPTPPAPAVAAVAVAPVAAVAESREPRPAANPPETRVAERPIERVPERVPDRVAVEPVRAPERVAAVAPARAPERAPETVPARNTTAASAQPGPSGRRLGLDVTLGLLGSVTPIRVVGFTPTVHVTALSFIGAQYRGWGAYLAPEFGSGGGIRSQMLAGGLSRDLLNIHMLRATALAGYAINTETSTDSLAAGAPVVQNLRGPSVGGMASIPLLGPVRLAYRGQYVKGAVAGAAIIRHSVGLTF